MIVFAGLVLVAAAIAAHRFWPHPIFELPTPDVSLLEQRMKSELIVTLKSGQAFRGVLFEHDADVFVLRNAQAVSPDTDGRPTVTAVDGELVLLVADVAYCQRP